MSADKAQSRYPNVRAEVSYFVRSTDGTDYRVGYWLNGVYFPGARADAIRELQLLDEPGSYVWGRSW